MSVADAEPAGLSVARGVLRDALAGINNLQLLLSSRKVAPKSISQLLGDLSGTCDGIVPAFRQGVSALEAPTRPPLQPSALPALRELEAFLSEQVGQFREALERASSRSMNAASRLALEHAIVAVSEQLSGALPLLDLWADLGSESFAVDLAELVSLSRVGDQPQTPGALGRELQLDAGTSRIRLLAPPRALLNLVGVVAACLDPARKTQVFDLRATDLALAAEQAGGFELRVEPQPREETYRLLVPPHVRPTLQTAIAIARELGLNMRLDSAVASLKLV